MHIFSAVSTSTVSSQFSHEGVSEQFWAQSEYADALKVANTVAVEGKVSPYAAH